jgi:dCMP deaminase
MKSTTKLKNKSNQYKPVDGHIRPSWDEYFLDIMKTVSERATCDRGRASCVFVKDKQILVTGYVGSPIGMPHCDEVGHQLKKMIHEDGHITEHCVRTVHAEQNAICQAARRGVSLEDSTVYVNMTPCRTCAMLLINTGVKRIVAQNKYHAGQESEEMFKKAKIKLEFISKEVVKYNK